MFLKRNFELLLKSFIFTFLLMLLCFAVRVAFVVYIGHFHGAIYEPIAEGESLAFQIGLMFYNGLIHDFRGVGAFATLYFVLGFLGILFRSFFLSPPPISKTPFLNFYAYVIFALFLFVSIANMTYYTIFNDVFNVILLGLFLDDQKAILADGLSGQYYLSVKVLCLIVALWIWIRLYRYMVGRVRIPAWTFKKYFGWNLSLVLSFGILMLCCINSSFSFGNKSLDMKLRPVSNVFLNKIIPSPFRSLYLVYRSYKNENNATFSTFTSKTFNQTIQDFFNLKSDSVTLQEALKQTSTNPLNTPSVDHIFYIVAESFGRFAFDSVYDEIGLLSGLKGLVDNEKGFWVKDFFEVGPRTAYSMECQLGGVYWTGIYWGPKAPILSSTITAPATNFKRAGFEPHFYYSGSGNWRNIFNFVQTQGFDSTFGMEKMISFAEEKRYPLPYKNVWGVWENVLFDFVAHETEKHKKPTFNVILTTTFHGPYDLPWNYIEELGGNQAQFEEFVRTKSAAMGPHELAILWWVDKQITRFIKEMSQKYPRSIFVVTGDHNVPSLGGTQVAMVVYSPTLKLRKDFDSGDHLDIASTLLSLTTPKGFEYFSFGKPIFSFVKNQNPLKWKNVMGYQSSGDIQKVYTEYGYEINLKTEETNRVDSDQAKYYLQRLRDGQALSWYLFSMKKNNK